MREIKFRAWDNTDKCWYEPIYEAYKGNLYELLMHIQGGLVLNTGKSSLTDESRFPDRFTLEQYTGLKDKNGVEIYEGDIAEDCRGNKYIITWDELRSAWWCDEIFKSILMSEINQLTKFNAINNLMVIGNIHENKEHLKG